MAITLRANEASILYNAACTYAILKRKREALETIKKPGKPASKIPFGPGATPTSLSFTTIPNSSASIPSPPIPNQPTPKAKPSSPQFSVTTLI